MKNKKTYGTKTNRWAKNLRREGFACSNLFVILGLIIAPIILFLISNDFQNIVVNIIAFLVNTLILANITVFAVIVLIILLILLILAIYIFLKL